MRSCIEQAVIFSAGSEIIPEDLNLGGETVLELDRSPMISAAEAERLHITRVLKALAGNRHKAAKVLGMARSTLILKIKEYGIE